MKIHIMGASGSGTTTLGQALARTLPFRHLDTDQYYWLPTVPPYQQKRLPAERQSLLQAEMDTAGHVVVTGSLLGWGAEIEQAFDLIVFLYLPSGLRIARLRQREIARFGTADPGFLDWAAQYDEGTAEGRSLAKHRAWLAQRTCHILRLEQDHTVDERVASVVGTIHHISQQQAAVGSPFI